MWKRLYFYYERRVINLSKEEIDVNIWSVDSEKLKFDSAILLNELVKKLTPTNSELKHPGNFFPTLVFRNRCGRPTFVGMVRNA
jgi:hypothetical protein